MRTANAVKYGNIVLLVAMLSFSKSLLAEVSLQPIDFDPDQWIDPFQPISVQLTHESNPANSRLAFFIGSHDVTALMIKMAPGVYRYKASLAPLPSGENTLTVHLIHSNNEWTELVSTSLRVLTTGGFEESEITPPV